MSLRKSRAERRMSEKLTYLFAEYEATKYRIGVVRGLQRKAELQNDVKQASIMKNRIVEIELLQQEIKSEIFQEIRVLFQEK